MRKNLHGKILRRKLKEQHLSIVSKFCPLTIYWVFTNKKKNSRKFYLTKILKEI